MCLILVRYNSFLWRYNPNRAYVPTFWSLDRKTIRYIHTHTHTYTHTHTHTHIHPLGLFRTSDHLLVEGATCTTLKKTQQTHIHELSEIRTRDLFNKGTSDLHLDRMATGIGHQTLLG